MGTLRVMPARLIELVVFGRTAMGEMLTDVTLATGLALPKQDRFTVSAQMTGDAVAKLAMSCHWPRRRAMATIIYANPDAEARLSARAYSHRTQAAYRFCPRSASTAGSYAGEKVCRAVRLSHS
jgi:hypothetical protein